MASGGYERIFIYVLTSFDDLNLFVFIFTRNSNSMIKTAVFCNIRLVTDSVQLGHTRANRTVRSGPVGRRTEGIVPVNPIEGVSKLTWTGLEQIKSSRFIFPIESISGSVTVVKQGDQKLSYVHSKESVTYELWGNHRDSSGPFL